MDSNSSWRLSILDYKKVRQKQLIYQKSQKFSFSTSIEAPKLVPMFPAYYIFNGLLILLLLLHIFWTYLILKIAYNSLNAGQMEGDIRSSSSNYSEDSKSE